MPLANAVRVVRTYLAGEFPDIRVLTETPHDLARELPVIRVRRIGGQDTVLTLDVANIDVDAYAIGEAAATALAEQVRTSLRLNAEGQTIAGVEETQLTPAEPPALIAQVDTISAPKWVPYDNTALRRISATYRIAIRSIP